jgi:hypothetical protein
MPFADELIGHHADDESMPAAVVSALGATNVELAGQLRKR